MINDHVGCPANNFQGYGHVLSYCIMTGNTLVHLILSPNGRCKAPPSTPREVCLVFTSSARLLRRRLIKCFESTNCVTYVGYVETEGNTYTVLYGKGLIMSEISISLGVSRISSLKFQ